MFGKLRLLAAVKTQLGRLERTGAPGGLRSPGFGEAPASEPAHLSREAKSLKAEQAMEVGGWGVINYFRLGLMLPTLRGGWHGRPADFICTQWT